MKVKVYILNINILILLNQDPIEQLLSLFVLTDKLT